MKRAKLTIREYPNNPPSRRYVVDLRSYGKGRKFFATKIDAENERRRQEILRNRAGSEAVGLPHSELAAIIQARKQLAAHGKTISDATAFYLDYLERIKRCNITVSQLALEVLRNKEKDGCSDIYLRDLRTILLGSNGDNPSLFAERFGQRAIAGITVEELDTFMRDIPGSPVTRSNWRRNISVLFGVAEARGYIDRNPVLRTSKPKLIDKAPEIFTPDEIRALLEAAQRIHPDAVPMLAIGAFAGVRDAELKRLHWQEVNLQRNLIEIRPEKSKTAKRRFIEIQPNLAQWLAPHAARHGSLVPRNARKKVDAVCKAAELQRWSKNGLRHSFASYRLAATNNAPLVATELGHTSPAMLFSVYRELVHPDEAARYWQITPAVEAANVVTFANEAQM
jgi:integrase